MFNNVIIEKYVPSLLRQNARELDIFDEIEFVHIPSLLRQNARELDMFD